LSPASANVTIGSTLQLNVTKRDQYNNSMAAAVIANQESNAD